MKIAVDAMGGDNAPSSIIKGVEMARNEFEDMEFILFGDIKSIQPLINNDNRITLVQSQNEISMNDEPVRSIRQKKDSSLVLAATMVKKGNADAFFSCGNSGAVLAASLFIIGRMDGIDRPGFLTTLPTISSQIGGFNLLDSGANSNNKPEHLYQYAILGKYYAQSVRNIKNPKIGLLNNGVESHKGTDVTRKAYQLIKSDSNINFIGNVESNSLTFGICDVVIADGFTGNAVLKSIEGTASSVMLLFKNSIKNAHWWSKMGALMFKSDLVKIKNRVNPARYGGAVVLGVKAPVIKAHGSSKSDTVYFSMKQIRTIINNNLLYKFKNAFEK